MISYSIFKDAMVVSDFESNFFAESSIGYFLFIGYYLLWFPYYFEPAKHHIIIIIARILIKMYVQLGWSVFNDGLGLLIKLVRKERGLSVFSINLRVGYGDSYIF